MHTKLTNIFKHQRYSLLIIALTFVLSSCKITRNVPENKYLLTQNRIKINTTQIDKAELQTIIKQKPNRKFFGIIRFNLRAYNTGSVGKERKWKNWFKNTIGEPPVIIDSLLSEKSAKQMQLYLYKKGYFNSHVQLEYELKKNKKGKIIYNINARNPYTIKDFIYSMPDNEVSYFIKQDSLNCLIKKGKNYDEDKLEEERVRINNYLRNVGYYFFVKDYLTYKVDSSLGTQQMNIYLSLSAPYAANKDSLTEHNRYTINNVYVYPYYISKQKNINYLDTLLYNNNIFVFNSSMRFKPKTLSRPIFIQKDDFFTQRYVDETYKRINLLKNFKQTTIYFEDVSTDSKNLLNAFVKLTPNPKQSISLSTEGTNSSGNLGISGSFNYQNRNVFKGAEILDFKVKAGLEAQQIVVESDTSTSQRIYDYLPFNTLEFGPELSLSIPRFALLPYTKFAKRADPKTILTMGYNYQARPDYYRTIANFSYGYSWKETTTKQHLIYPMDLNFVKVNMSESFRYYVDSVIQDQLVQQSYKDLMINSFKYSYIYNNQDVKKKKTIYQYFRLNLEQAGGMLYLLSKNVFKLEKEPNGEGGDSSYYLFNNEKLSFLKQPFAQFAKVDFDYRIYKPLKGFRKLVFRTTMGVGYAYGNSKYLPFIKSFFGGGANDIRAWRARTLGPGAFPKSSVARFDQIGDIKLQFNLEYRYKIYKSLHGATFIDAGNIWLLQPDVLRTGGEFEANDFYKEIAAGAGFGFRYDFSFFIFRLDLAIPVYDPSISQTNRWALTRSVKNLSQELRGQIGIGYPF